MKKITYILIILLLFSLNLFSELFDSIFIIINDDVVTLNEYREHFSKLKEAYLKQKMSLPKNVKKDVFNSLIGEKIIQQIAMKAEIFVSDTEVEDAKERIMISRRWTEKIFKQALKQSGSSLKEWEEGYRKQMLIEKIKNIEVRPRVTPPTEEEKRDYYEKNKKEMYDPPKARISHILIKDNPKASLTERSKIKNKAKKVLEKALSGKNFKKLAKKYSDDKVSAQNGGDIGYINKGEWLGPQIDSYIFKLKKGEVFKEVLPSPHGGYHIVKVTGWKTKKLIPYEDVSLNIEEHLVKEQMAEELDKWLEEQKQNGYLEVIFPGDEKYIYDYNKWKKKNSKKYISNEDFFNKIKSISL